MMIQGVQKCRKTIESAIEEPDIFQFPGSSKFLDTLRENVEREEMGAITGKTFGILSYTKISVHICLQELEVLHPKKF